MTCSASRVRTSPPSSATRTCRTEVVDPSPNSSEMRSDAAISSDSGEKPSWPEALSRVLARPASTTVSARVTASTAQGKRAVTPASRRIRVLTATPGASGRRVPAGGTGARRDGPLHAAGVRARRGAGIGQSRIRPDRTPVAHQSAYGRLPERRRPSMPGPEDDTAAERPVPDGMVVVYWRPGCPWCGRLLRWIDRAGLPVDLRNIWDEPDAAEELRAITGGDETVPTVNVAGVGLVNPSPKVLTAAVHEHLP